jgi:hypothetical protein
MVFPELGRGAAATSTMIIPTTTPLTLACLILASFGNNQGASGSTLSRSCQEVCKRAPAARQASRHPRWGVGPPQAFTAAFAFSIFTLLMRWRSTSTTVSR